MAYRRTTQFTFDSLASLLLLGGFLVVLFLLVRGVFILLSYAAPFLLVAALVIERSVVIDYGRWLIARIRQNLLSGLLLVLLTGLGYMLVFPFLFLKAILHRRLKDNRRRQTREHAAEFVDFEEVDSRTGSSLRSAASPPEGPRKERIACGRPRS
jgi:hypothetical protein